MFLKLGIMSSVLCKDDLTHNFQGSKSYPNVLIKSNKLLIVIL